MTRFNRRMLAGGCWVCSLLGSSRSCKCICVVTMSVRASRLKRHSLHASQGSRFSYTSRGGRGAEVVDARGCTALLLEPLGSSFRVVDRFTLAGHPIRILPSMTNGWRDIAMEVRGGGIHPRRTVVLMFNDHKYPSNPSMAPELSSARADQEGVILPLDEQGDLLYA